VLVVQADNDQATDNHSGDEDGEADTAEPEHRPIVRRTRPCTI
jgi:hypothetical protein